MGANRLSLLILLHRFTPLLRKCVNDSIHKTTTTRWILSNLTDFHAFDCESVNDEVSVPLHFRESGIITRCIHYVIT